MQVFIDQAMRVPKLLVGIELGGRGQQDLSPDDVPSFPNVTGNRGDLAAFSGVKRQPDDDIRLISTPGFVNLPSERSERIRVPLLFEYRGEIVPSLPLQAIMLWLRITPAEVEIELGSRIILPNGWQIPIHRDGTVTINPIAKQSVRRLTLNQLLLAAQEHEKHRPPSLNIDNLKDQIVLLRLAGDPLQPSNVFATAIATIQNNAYVRPAPWAVPWLIILAAALLSCFLWMISKPNLVLGAIIFVAGYALLTLSLLATDRRLGARVSPSGFARIFAGRQAGRPWTETKASRRERLGEFQLVLLLETDSQNGLERIFNPISRKKIREGRRDASAEFSRAKRGAAPAFAAPDGAPMRTQAGQICQSCAPSKVKVTGTITSA